MKNGYIKEKAKRLKKRFFISPILSDAKSSKMWTCAFNRLMYCCNVSSTPKYTI